MIESGHFRFHLVGEKILHLDARLFYKHRGLERAAEGAELDDGIRYMARACAACAVTNGVAYAQAVEQLLGYRAGRELARARTVLLELERVWSHLNDVSAVCAGTGLAAGAQRFAGLTERARRLNAELTGHRFLFGSVSVRGSRLGSGRKRDPGCAARARRAAGAKRPPAGASSSSTARSRIGFRESASFARETPAASARRGRQRAHRVSKRTRGRPVPSSRTTASCPRSRPAPSATCRAAWSSVTSSSSSPSSSSRRSSTGPLEPSAAENGGDEPRLGAARVESPRGATLCVVERDGDRVARVHLRTGSYANWPVVAYAAAGNMLPDFPLINKSFELCYACADR